VTRKKEGRKRERRRADKDEHPIIVERIGVHMWVSSNMA
jgi:hypothetical protein